MQPCRSEFGSKRTIRIKPFRSFVTMALPSFETHLAIPSLLHLRQLGRSTSAAINQGITRKRNRLPLCLQVNPSIACPSAAPVTSLHVDRTARFLIAASPIGGIFLYDLSKWGLTKDPCDPQTQQYQPVAHALEQGVSCARWYAVDSGAFVTSGLAGKVQIWDSRACESVATYEPYKKVEPRYRRNNNSNASEESSNLPISGMDVSTLNETTIVVCSRQDPAVKLVDIRSGAASHSLMAGKTTCVKWSPISPFLVASGGLDHCVRLWDIRKSVSLLKVLDREYAPNDATVSRPVRSHGAHLRLPVVNKRAKTLNNVQVIASSHDRPVQQIAFDEYGQYLVSSDGSLALWDLRNGQLVARRFETPHGSSTFTHDSSHYLPLTVTDGTIWTGWNSCVIGFSLELGGKPRTVLKGHLGRVADVVDVPGGGLMSTAADRLILMWGRGEPTRHGWTETQGSRHD
jgi:WD40 repeat protein